jgi:hypothetical protein
MIKTITNNRTLSGNITLMNLNEPSSNNSQVTANAFNEYFSMVAEKLLINNPSGKPINNNDNNEFSSYLHKKFYHSFPSMKFGNTNTSEIENTISSLKPKISYGYDEISARILKASAPYVSSLLTHIFNKIFVTGTFPDRLTYSKIKPFYKKGDKSDLANYRPISLLPFPKLLEKSCI